MIHFDIPALSEPFWSSFSLIKRNFLVAEMNFIQLAIATLSLPSLFIGAISGPENVIPEQYALNYGKDLGAINQDPDTQDIRIAKQKEFKSLLAHEIARRKSRATKADLLSGSKDIPTSQYREETRKGALSRSDFIFPSQKGMLGGSDFLEFLEILAPLRQDERNAAMNEIVESTPQVFKDILRSAESRIRQGLDEVASQVTPYATHARDNLILPAFRGLRNQVQKIEAFVDPYATHAVEKYISPAAKELEERSKKIRAKLAENAIHAWDKYIYYKSRRLREQAKKKYRAHLAPQNATDAGDKGISPAAEELGERAE